MAATDRSQKNTKTLLFKLFSQLKKNLLFHKLQEISIIVVVIKGGCQEAIVKEGKQGKKTEVYQITQKLKICTSVIGVWTLW